MKIPEPYSKVLRNKHNVIKQAMFKCPWDTYDDFYKLDDDCEDYGIHITTLNFDVLVSFIKSREQFESEIERTMKEVEREWDEK